MSADVELRLPPATSNTAAPVTRADAAVADYAANVAGELPVVRADRERDDADLTGHRVTELTLDDVAA
jgi:hypothetical protein